MSVVLVSKTASGSKRPFFSELMETYREKEDAEMLEQFTGSKHFIEKVISRPKGLLVLCAEFSEFIFKSHEHYDVFLEYLVIAAKETAIGNPLPHLFFYSISCDDQPEIHRYDDATTGWRVEKKNGLIFYPKQETALRTKSENPFLVGFTLKGEQSIPPTTTDSIKKR